MDEVCDDAMDAYNQCANNKVISSNDQCFRMSYFNKFALSQNQFAYAWMYFDSNATQKVYNYCSNSVSNWKISLDKYKAGLQFAFGS